MMLKLLSTYILTGCDTVSYPYRRGKRRAYITAVDHLTDLLPFCQYGDPEESLEVREDVVTAARRYMVSLHERSDFAGNLDALRAHLFGNIKADMRCLPPTKNAIHLHLRQASHQLAIWKRAQMFQPVYPVGSDFGRELVSGKLVATMMLKEAKPVVCVTNTVAGRKACMPDEDASVRQPMCGVSCYRMSLHRHRRGP